MNKRIPKNNDEQEAFFDALPGKTIIEKLTAAGMILPGVFHTGDNQIVGLGR